ncbi:MAG: hypothetical protein JWP74_2981 [Marmoricola sp.]|nr:hypothetical protein [Marmoricola sp.]
MHDISERPQQREDFIFSRVIEESLLGSGHGADVWTAAVASEPTRLAFRTWEEQVKAWSPDVVILSYGYYEVIHLFLPRWLERHANSLKTRPGRVRELYRTLLVRKVWMALAKLQCRLDAKIGGRFFGRRIRQVEKELHTYIDRTREVGQPLIMLFEFLPPGQRGRGWFPGMTERTAMMNEMLHRLVADYDNPEIMLVRIPEIAERRLPPGTEPNTDGFHYTGALHRYIGEEIADEIRRWAKQYPRLGPKD